EGVRLEPGSKCRAVLGPESALEEGCVLVVSLRGRLQPEGEGARVVQLFLTAPGGRLIGEGAVLVGEAVLVRLSPVPARGLVAAPRRSDRHHGQQNRPEDLDDLRASNYCPVVSVVVTAVEALPASEHFAGKVTCRLS